MKKLTTMWIPSFLATALVIGGFGLIGMATPGLASVIQDGHDQHHQSGSQAKSPAEKQEKKAEADMMNCMKDPQMRMQMMQNMMQNESMRQEMMKMMTERMGEHSGMMQMHMGMMMESDACQQMMVNVLRENPQMRQMMKKLVNEAEQPGANQ